MANKNGTSLQNPSGYERDTVQNLKNTLLNFPNEVTSIIFEYGHALSKAPWRKIIDKSVESTRPLLFEIVASHVCRHWRAFALAYPRLWAHFRSGTNSLSISSERFAAYLERSGGSDLELWFDFTASESNFEEPARLMQMAILHIQRWKRFTLFSDISHPILPNFAALVSASAPRLEHFAFSAPNGNTLDRSRNLLRSSEAMVFRGGASNLRSLAIDFTGAFTCRPPLENITTLFLQGEFRAFGDQFHPSIVHHILSLPLLVNLSVVGDFYVYIEPDERPIMMPKLKHFRLANSAEFIFLLPFMRAPLLETLTLKEVDFASSFATQPHESDTLISDRDIYVFPALQSVCFIDVTITSVNTTRHFAKMTANASDITFCKGEDGHGFFTTLTDPSFAEAPWKKLEVFTFDINDDAPIHTNDLDGLIHLSEKYPNKNIILQLFDTTDEILKDCDSAKYAQIAMVYKMKRMDSEQNWLRQVKWPPSSGKYDAGLFTAERDPFSINNYYIDSDESVDTDSDLYSDDSSD